MFKKKNKPDEESHIQILEAYNETLDLKQKFIKQLSKKLSAKKSRLDELFNVKQPQELSKKKVQFNISDLIGVDYVKAKLSQKKSKHQQQVYNSINDQLTKDLLQSIEKGEDVYLDIFLTNLKQNNQSYQHRDTFIQDIQSNRNRMRAKQSLRRQNSDSSLLSHTNFQIEEKFNQILVSKKNKKLNLQKLILKEDVPEVLKFAVYQELLDDNNVIDKNFYQLQKQLDARMPEYIQKNIQESTHLILCSLNYVDKFMENKIYQLLKIFYNYRPDIGFKSGLEIYAYLLSIYFSDYQLLKIFISLVLDNDLVFAVFKGEHFYLNRFQRLLLIQSKYINKQFEKLYKDYKDLIVQFFKYCVSVFFISFFQKDNIIKVLDLVMAFKERAFINLYIILFNYAEQSLFQTCKNCYQLEKQFQKIIKYKKEEEIIENLRKSINQFVKLNKSQNINMGNTKQSLPKLQKFDVEILLDKIYQHMLLQRDRKINELAQKEISQREFMSQKLCSYEEVSFEFISIVGVFNYVQAVKIIMRYCKSLKDYSIRICKAQQKNDFDEIEDLQPYIEGIIWSAEKLNLSYIKEFNNMIYKYFGNEVYARLRRYNNLDAQLRSLFSNIEPTTREIQNYLTKFLLRYKLKMKDFPEGGQGNDGGNNNNGGGGQKDDFMNQINNLKFNDDKNQNQQQKQDYQDIPLNNNDFNYQPQNNNYGNNQQNQGLQNSFNNNKQNNDFMNPQDVNYPAFDNKEVPEYQPQYQQKEQNDNNDDNFDDMINKLDEDNGISGVKKELKKRESAMDQQSDFVTKEILPTNNQNQQQNFMVGKKINQNDLDYDATKYYINSLIGKDNDYKIDLGDSMKPDEKN